MYDESIKVGSTSVVVLVTMRDSTTGQGKTGLAFGAVTAAWVRDNGTTQSITLAAGSPGDAYSSGKWAEVNAASNPGDYELHVPNTILAAGQRAKISLKAAGAIDKKIDIKLVAFDVQNGVNLGLSGVGGQLSGPSAVTLNWHDAGGNPVPNVDFTVLGQGASRGGVDGTKAFGLPDGTYTVVSRATGTSLFANYQLVVSGTTAATITGTAANVTPATDPSQTNAFTTTYDGQGNRKPNVPVTFKMMSPPGDAGRSFDGMEFTVTSDGSGDVLAALVRLTDYDVWRGTGKRFRITTPDATTYELPAQLGVDTD